MILVDLWTEDPVWGAWSEQALDRAAERGPLAVNPIIYAELCLGFARESVLDEALENAGVRRLALPYRAAWPAASAFGAYRRRGGKRSLPDYEHHVHRRPTGLIGRFLNGTD